MVTLYGYTILAVLALLAAVIAIFVFASSFYRGALELSTKEEEDSLNRRKGLINSKRNELSKKLRDVDESAFLKEVRAELDKLDAQLKNIDQSIMKSRNKAKALAVRRMVNVPGSLLLASIVASGIAIATSGTLPTIMWILSLVLLVTSLYFIYRNLCAVEFFSGIIDLSTLMEHALERHKMKSIPIVDMDIWDFKLEIEHGETKEIEMALFLSLKQGLTAKNVRVRFSGTEELDFPGEKIEQLQIEHKNMRSPKQFWRKVGVLNYGSHREIPLKVKAPNQPGEYTMTYWIQCDEYTGDETAFKIRVI